MCIYAFRGQLEYFAMFNFLYGVSYGVTYIFVTVFALADSSVINEKPLIVPRILLITVYAI